jgi:hypothetical protein
MAEIATCATQTWQMRVRNRCRTTGHTTRINSGAILIHNKTLYPAPSCMLASVPAALISRNGELM